jgi:molybdopterin/thiamine biosynthesis adenylyltransferase/rhodanese-related sulfurtransferase
MSRYARQTILPEIGTKGQETLLKSHVLVIGAGGLGCPVIQYLAAGGIGKLTIVDDDIVAESNLQRQVLFRTSDIGKSKAKLAAEFARNLNPDCTAIAIEKRLDIALAKTLIPEADVVVDGTDNFATRYLLNDACVHFDKPLVAASILKFEGQLSVYNYKGGPTYRCLFPEPPKAGEMPSCSEAGVLGFLAGTLGTLQANEVFKVVLQLDEVMSGKILNYNALNNTFDILSYSKNEPFEAPELLDNYEEICAMEVPTEVRQLNVHELKNWMDSGEEFELIDVREPFEFDLANLDGKLIPMNTIPSSIDAISKDKKVVVHCHHGIRSANVISYLQSMHKFTNLYNLEGGIDAWSRSIDSGVDLY